jgi:predicted amidophosphoribosyltransferase
MYHLGMAALGLLRRHIGEAAAYLDAAADFWLGVALPTPERALADAHWKPDDREAYCGRCGDSVGPGEADPSGCGSCRGKPAVADGIVRLGPYTGDLRRWVLAVKYHQRWTDMARTLGGHLADALADSGLVDPARAVIVPMPMPWQRRLYRGIDHARIIAAAVAARLNAPLAPALRKANGPPQVSRPSSLRARSGARGLSIRRRLGGWNLVGLDLVLVDDVRTTGASIRSAVHLLRRLRPRRLVAAVLAVSDAAARRDRFALAPPAREAHRDSADPVVPPQGPSQSTRLLHG